ncbi:MAG TPA: nucleotidyltransferase domain-containing protein [Candidatus Binatia bacterium]|nr:nucleotidyltransferase domain-containing protein [Candidatus Binatia bacterium]
MHEDAVISDALTASVKDLVAVYRFGSTVSGQQHSDSDVDVAVLGRTPLDPLERFQLQEELALRLHRDVDLVDLRRASTVMRMQVVSTGLCFLVADETERDRFEDYVFAAYARLNEERRGILDQIRRDGRVYDG